MAVVAAVCRDADAALPTYKLPAPKVRSCHLPGHPGPQVRWTASPFNFNPEQLEGQRATFQSLWGQRCGGLVRGLERWLQGRRLRRESSPYGLDNLLSFSGPQFPQLEIRGDSTWRPAPSSPRVQHCLSTQLVGRTATCLP